jgi:hypothetical protein
MNGLPEFREPLHQPPDPLDLRQFPPTSPKCASVRGRLRDFADGDLHAADRIEVEEHVHGCRTCAVALARAEHEVLRLRRAFGVVANHEAEAGSCLRDGFAARVVQRLVLDETSLLSRDQIAKAVATAPAVTGSGAGGVRSVEPPVAVGMSSFRTAGFFVGAAVLLLVLVVGAGLRFGFDQQPERTARLTITQAADTYGDGVPLGRGDGLGEDQSLWVGVRGRAWFDWHDASTRSQPAATMQVTNSGRVKVHDGEPLLVNGNLLVETRRPVTIPVADGSRLDLGVGEYLISAEALGGLYRERDPLASAPAGLRVAIEVLRGDGAQILRETSAPTLVAPGVVGIYEGDSPVEMQAGGSSGVGVESGRGGRQDPVEEPVSEPLFLQGSVFDRFGGGVAGANVHVAFASGGMARSGMAAVGFEGRFELATGPVGTNAACDSPFAIVTVLPPAKRSEFGASVPQAFRLVYGEGRATLASSPVLDASWPLLGTVRDDLGLPRSGVRVLPCVVDELFPCVLVMPSSQAVSGSNGEFRLPGLPVVMPHHQHLAVLLLHPELEPTIVRVAPRNSIAARFASDPFQAPRLRTIRLQGLPEGTTVQLLEDIKGMPPGSGLVRRTVTTDGEGKVGALQVGSGALWLRCDHPANPMVRAVTLVELQGTPAYEPTGGLLPYHTQFRPVEALTGTDVCVDNSYRFELYSTRGADNPPRAQVVTAYEALSSRTLAGSQVFAVAPIGPRGTANTRFLGFTSGTGQLGIELLPGENGIVTIGPDGTVGSGAPLGAGAQVAVSMQDCGRVLLDESLRPSAASNRQAVAILFERADPWLVGLQPILVRFASASEGWIVSGVPPGEYRATVDGVHRSVTVTNGLVVLF